MGCQAYHVSEANDVKDVKIYLDNMNAFEEHRITLTWLDEDVDLDLSISFGNGQEYCVVSPTNPICGGAVHHGDAN